MACNADDYKYAWQCVGRWLKEGVDYISPLFEPVQPYAKIISPWFDQKRLAAFCLTVFVIIPLTALFVYVGRIVVPKFVKWYYDKTITQRAVEYYAKRCVATGMTLPGAKVSIGLGVGFYFLIRIAAAFPEHPLIGLMGLFIAFCVISSIGDLYEGKVPNNSRAQLRYFKRFHAPTVTGLGLAVGTVVFDFIIQGLIVGISYLKSIVVGSQIAMNM
jgi:hypothetical protein